MIWDILDLKEDILIYEKTINILSYKRRYVPTGEVEKFLAFNFVANNLSFHKLGAISYMEKTHIKILGLFSIASHAPKILAIRYSSASTVVS